MSDARSFKFQNNDDNDVRKVSATLRARNATTWVLLGPGSCGGVQRGGYDHPSLPRGLGTLGFLILIRRVAHTWVRRVGSARNVLRHTLCTMLMLMLMLMNSFYLRANLVT